MLDIMLDDLSLIKRQLQDAIIRNNYDLQSPEIMTLSKQLDTLMIPIFENQLNCYKYTHPSCMT